MKDTFGNILGSSRAENDHKMLKEAFVETSDYHGLTRTYDYNFVVGRRGTGKSALYIKTTEYFSSNKAVFLLNERIIEHEILSLQSVFTKLRLTDYITIRSITRVAWRMHLLLLILKRVLDYWKIDKIADVSQLRSYYDHHLDCFQAISLERCSTLILKYGESSATINDIPGLLARHCDIENLHRMIQETLVETNHSTIFLFDGLDEGWLPNKVSTAILGGLASATADFSDRNTGIHVVLFVRDNIFRTLAHYDPDFSRNIEGSILRLKWDQDSLLHIAADRLRASLGISKKEVENDIRVWNRFAQRELKDRSGFNECLNHTLFRPRDLIVLLNSAYQVAARATRNAIIKSDIDATAKQISEDRLKDLIKEYENVFKGLKLFINVFRQGKPHFTCNDAYDRLNELIKTSKFDEEGSGDFAILGQGKEALFALFSVGFIGIQDKTTLNIIFCHDGSRYNLSADLLPDQLVYIHPCYLRALDIDQEEALNISLESIDDEYDTKPSTEIADLRMKQIGRLVAELPSTTGKETAVEFENWVLKAVKLLFNTRLHNPELHPNRDAVERRDVVATNMAQFGFWSRILNDYKTRQVVFEIKNYVELKSDDFRQCLSYSGGEYGGFSIIVNRSESEGLNEHDRSWVKSIYDQHKVMIFILPASIISRCISKLRKEDRFDYTEDLLMKRLDVFVRQYLSLRAPQKAKNKKLKNE